MISTPWALHRNNVRFETVFAFACMVLRGRSQAPVAGGSTAFSLLFPMLSVFEEFISRFIQKNAARFGYAPADVHLQARGHHRFLVRGDDSRRRWLVVRRTRIMPNEESSDEREQAGAVRQR